MGDRRCALPPVSRLIHHPRDPRASGCSRKFRVGSEKQV